VASQFDNEATDTIASASCFFGRLRGNGVQPGLEITVSDSLGKETGLLLLPLVFLTYRRRGLARALGATAVVGLPILAVLIAEVWQTANNERALRRLAKKLLAESEEDVECCYEAGLCGYTVKRELERRGVCCRVVAPASIRAASTRAARSLPRVTDREGSLRPSWKTGPNKAWSRCMLTVDRYTRILKTDLCIRRTLSRHVVATIPRFLRGVFLKRRELLLDLAQSIAEAIVEYARRRLGDQARPGVVVSIATSGDVLQWHPHGHAPDVIYVPFDDEVREIATIS
jgi:hypothetical protein